MKTKYTYFPQKFLDKYSVLLGEEWEKFFETIKTKQPKSFWINTNKTTIEKIKESLTKKEIKFYRYPFSEQAFEIELEKPGELEEYKKGLISIQEKAAMMPVIALNPEKKDFVLDACAAPGMKTIQLSNLSGKVLACDVHSKRFEALEKTRSSFKLENVETKRIDFRNLKKNKKFDKILLDAPCSSEGLVRKKRDALLNWSNSMVYRKAKEQKHLIVKAFDYLKEGGEMVYSTCSFAPEENEEVVLRLLEQRKNARTIKCEELLKGVKIRKNELCENCVRLYPQDNNTQQFFFAKIKKETA
jgi:NOL1/NOP2/sun family putative RNA methylase